MADTLTISLTGSAIVPNISKSYSLSDSDLQSLLNYAKSAYSVWLAANFNPSNAPNFVPTNQQILLAWLQAWVDETKANVQRFATVPSAPPPPIVIS